MLGRFRDEPVVRHVLDALVDVEHDVNRVCPARAGHGARDGAALNRVRGGATHVGGESKVSDADVPPVDQRLARGGPPTRKRAGRA